MQRTIRSRAAAEVHDVLPDLAGPAAFPMLTAAVRALDAELVDFDVEQFTHDPGVSCSVTYSVRCRWPGGVESSETLTAISDVAGLPDGVAVLADPTSGTEIGLWRYPFDPQLPGLADVVLPERGEATLGGVVGTIRESEVLSYRAGRRAVLRVVGSAGTIYVKVVRPHRSERLTAVHRALIDAGVPAPAVLAADAARGLVVLSALPGVALRSELMAACTQQHPAVLAGTLDTTADAVGALIDRIAAADLDGRPARRSPADDAAVHARSVVAAYPALSEVVAATMQRIAADAVDASDASQRCIVHGDLHDAQVLIAVEEAESPGSGGAMLGSVVGVVDLDDMGVGRLGDDWASLIGHGVALGCHQMLAGADPTPIVEWVDALWARCGDGPMRRSIGLRSAAVTLSLATGSLRTERDPRAAATATRLRVEVAAAMAADPEQSPGRTLENSHRSVIGASPRRGRTEASPPTTEEP